jgi:integrase
MKAFKEKNGFYQDTSGLWGISYRDSKGMKKREIVGAYSEAKAKRIQRLKEANEERQNPTKASTRKTFKELAPLFIKNHIENRQSKASYQVMFNQIESFFGNMRLGEINTLRISQYYHNLAKETSYSNANRHIGIISKFFNCLITWSEFHGVNPCAKVEKVADEEYEPNPLNEDEIELLLKSIANYKKPCVAFGFDTGLRRQELLGLRWEHIDFTAQTILIPKTKINKKRTLGLTEGLKQLLISLGVQKEGEVFKITGEQLKYQLTTACKKADIKHIRPHDMRHSFAVCFLNRGGRLEHLQSLLGHRSIKTTQKYMRFKKGEIASQMMVMDGMISSQLEIITGKAL